MMGVAIGELARALQQAAPGVPIQIELPEGSAFGQAGDHELTWTAGEGAGYVVAVTCWVRVDEDGATACRVLRDKPWSVDLERTDP